MVRPVIRPSLTFDHRALDGGQVIAFLNDLRHLIEGAGSDTFH
jgi:2-oxoglutarate dehydrogenase E2 component (dihydrolipoamide succinyltransferase)